MVEVSESIRIDRPREVVFAYLDKPENHAEVTPSLAESETVAQLDNNGKRARYVYEMARFSREGYLTETTREEGKRMVFELSGGITGEIDISLADAGDGTEVTYSADYDIPGRVLSAVTEPLVRRFNRRQLAKTLRNLESRLETEPSDSGR